jgi:cation channel sperm-associated protein 4
LGVTFFGTKSTKYFGDLPAALFTLFICITQDGWLGIFRELKEEGQYVAAAIYFTSFIMIGAFVFANLVVAVVVTNLELSVKQRAKQTERDKAEKDKPDESKDRQIS